MKNGEKIKKSFEKWHETEVAKAFGLKRVEESEALQDWLAVTGELSPERQKELEALRQVLSLRALSWNETELLVEFIAPLLYTVSFRNIEREIEGFSQRRLEWATEEYEASGVVDWMLARGDYEPRKPYFFLHKYKRFKQSAADPRGQLLIEMFVAQRLNNDDFPVYGVWIVGGAWRFLVLDQNVYSESYPYEATKQDALTKIWLILNKTKQIVYDRVDTLIEAENKLKNEKRN